MAFQNRQNHSLIAAFFIWICCSFFLPSMAIAAPTASSFSTSTDEDTILTVDLSAYVMATSPIYYKKSQYKGTATINSSTGVATFTPTANYNGTAAYFTYYVKDSTGTSTTAKVSITVNAVNDAPVASAVTVSATEDTAKRVTLIATDADSTSLTYSIVSITSYGTLGTPSGKYVTYTPSTNYNGPDSFTYSVSDGSLTSGTATVSVTVSAVNDAPTVAAFSAPTINEDEVSTVDLTPYASDIEGDALTFSEYSEYKGTVSIDATTGMATFTPTANYNGTAAYFRYRVQDTSGTYSSYAKVSYSIAAVNDAPVASEGSGSTNEDTATTVTLSATDVESSSLAYRLASQPAHGTATLSSRTVTYTPEANFNGTDTFTFYAYETSTTSSVSNTATVTMTVNAVNDAPTAADVSLTTAQDISLALTLDANDIDGDTLVYSFSTSTNATIAASGSSYVYTPNADYSGSDAFTYTVSDGVLSASANVTVTVTPNNETPVADDNTATTDEDTAVTITLTGSDAEGEVLTYAIASDPTDGVVSLSGNSSVYTPNTDSNGSDSFTFTVSDGTNTSTAATVTVTIRSVNDAPVASDVTGDTPENTAVDVTLTATDSENDALSYMALYSDHGDVTIDGETLTFTPDTGFGGTASISYRASDGQEASNTATVTIAVADASNDAPTAEDLSMTLSEDSEKTVILNASDPEDNDITYAIATEPTYGSVILSDDEVTYTPDPDFYGSDSFTYTASDGSATSAAATVALSVIAIPDPVVDCDMTLDPANEQTDATTSVTYWDNLVEVLMDAPATDAQLTELVSTAGGTGEVCKIEQSEMSADEITYLVSGADTSDTDYGIYRIKIPAQSSMADIEAVAATLSSLSYVSEAGGILTNIEESHAPETDAETVASSENKAMSDIFHSIQLQGAWEYLSKYRSKLASISLAMTDTGVCASAAYSSWCHASLQSGITDEFTNFRDGGNFIGVLETATSGQVADMPLGLIDRSTTFHGSIIATLLAAESNNNIPTSIGSGIVGSVVDLNYQVTSYRSSIDVDSEYNFDSKYASNPDTEILRDSCNAAAVNISHGPSVDFFRASDVVARWGFRTNTESALKMTKQCPALYVQSAGNDNTNLDTDPLASSLENYAYYSDDNYIGVQSTESNSTDRATISNYGSSVTVAAPGEGGTSYAAPLVTGTVGLLKAVDSSLSPTELIALLQAGKDTADTGTPFLDTAASVLLAIDGKDSDYVPMTLKYATYEAQLDLADLRDDNYASGDHNENGFWRLEDSTLTVERENTEMSESVPEDQFEDLARNIQMLSELKSTQKFSLGLVKTANSAGKETPFLAALPQGDATHELKGKFRLIQDWGDGINYDRAVAYGFQLEMALNEGASISENAFLVPLAGNTGKLAYEAPFKFTNMTLTGYLHEVSVEVTSDTELNSTYDDMQPLDPAENILPDDADNTDDFEAWEQSLSGTTFASQSCPEEGTVICDIPGSVCCEEGHENYYLCTHVAMETDCDDYEGTCGVSVVDGSTNGYYKFNITFDDTECTLSLNSYNRGTDCSYDLEYDGNYYQRFEYQTEDASSSTCTVMAHINIEYVWQAEYESYGSAYAWGVGSYDAPECNSENMTYTSRTTYETDQEVTFNFEDGNFPLTEIFEAIEFAWNDGDLPYAYRIVPDIVLNAGNITPGFGQEAQYYWSHGIGPIKPYHSDQQWTLDEMQKLDRSVP